VFVAQVFLLAQADAVLAGAGAVHRERAFDQPVVDRLDLAHLVGAFGSIAKQDVEIAVADMAQDRRSGTEASRSSLVSTCIRPVRLIGTQTSVVQPIACPAAGPCGEIGLVPRLPQSRLRASGEVDHWNSPPPLCRAISRTVSACSATARGTVELQQQGRLLGIVELGIGVDACICASSSISIRAIGTPIWIAWMTVSTAPFSVSKVQTAAAIASGMPCRRRVDLGDDAERALGADQQAGQVVAGRGFARAPPVRDDLAVGQDHLQARMLPRACCRSGPRWCRGARRDHAADGGVGARIDREEQALVAQMGVELLARTPAWTRSRDPRH
jgi:hypothetical protein